ncbi:flagellar motor protein MotB [Allosphingosinicella deserti]|uniref:Flagellar motor protein MotB n=1 Tax=Allosphingosinicella deserti TaxID=2116704 RepID=A0A2P7QNX5_9SPHN|nr:flagellar motor protein MotB [Sphingomonas deserti]PSJ39648.1 flagellar motor protein MotB [Sphingomonas deserti]
MASKARGRNEPLPRPIIVKKIVAAAHAGHHGGAWKVAYADFVTAMMAFFLLLWLLGMTDEQKRKGIADYFTPTLVELRQNSAGANGVLGGDSLIAEDDYAHRARQTGQRAIVVPRAAIGGPESGDSATQDRARFEALKRALDARMAGDPDLKALRKNVRLVETREGLRIDLVDEADFSMFALSTDRLLPRASRLIGEVAKVIARVPNAVIVRGHTDSLPYASGRMMNNWMLSTARAEATRAKLAQSGIGADRLARIEGVADREPFVPADRYDPRNRRMSVILAWQKGGVSGIEQEEARH